MSTINHGDTSANVDSRNKYFNRKFSKFNKITTVFAGVFVLGILFYDQFTTVSQDELQSIALLKSQLSSQESKDVGSKSPVVAQGSNTYCGRKERTGFIFG